MTTSTRQRWTLVATIVASAMTFIDMTVVNVALPALQRELGATITDVQWVVEAYALFLGALILVGGSLGDQFGRKRIFLLGVVWFTAASVWCGVAMSPRFLILGRALQGIGAAFLVPGSLAIISATFDGAERGRAIGTWSGFSAITTAVGPVIGGWLIENVSWRSAFFINVPLAAIVIALSLRYMDESRDPSRTARIDWVGALLAVAGLGGIVLGLLEWPPLGPGHPLVISSLVGGVVALALLILAEHREKSPMMPLHLFQSRAFSLTNLLTLLLYGALGVVLFLVPLLLIQVKHYSATAAGASFLPFPVIMFVLSRWSGGLVARTGPRLPLTAGPIIAAAGLALFARVGINDSYWTGVFPAVVVLGFGMAITVAPLTTTVMTAVPSDHAGVASGINNTVARVAGLLFIAVFGVVLVQRFDTEMRPTLEQSWMSPAAKAQIEKEMSKMAGAQLDSVPIEPRRRSVVQGAIHESFLSGFRLVVIEAAVLALVAAGFGAGIGNVPKSKTRQASGTPAA
ncbi:MAG TPA: MFS transporter [Gemmatimonadaceae bacterium]|nr:MFS transporter [Gemmatimonadaceae bacterium]